MTPPINQQLRSITSFPQLVDYLCNEFEPKKLPVVVLRRLLNKLVTKKRAAANPADRCATMIVPVRKGCRWLKTPPSTTVDLKRRIGILPVHAPKEASADGDGEFHNPCT